MQLLSDEHQGADFDLLLGAFIGHYPTTQE